MEIKEITKIGETNFKDFKTEIKITKKVKKYIKSEGISLAVLIPHAYELYEQILFESIDENWEGIPDKKFGKEFELIYNGITEGRDWNIKEGLKVEGFKEDLKLKKEPITFSGTPINGTPKNPKKSFIVNYLIIKKQKWK